MFLPLINQTKPSPLQFACQTPTHFAPFVNVSVNRHHQPSSHVTVDNLCPRHPHTSHQSPCAARERERKRGEPPACCTADDKRTRLALFVRLSHQLPPAPRPYQYRSHPLSANVSGHNTAAEVIVSKLPIFHFIHVPFSGHHTPSPLSIAPHIDPSRPDPDLRWIGPQMFNLFLSLVSRQTTPQNTALSCTLCLYSMQPQFWTMSNFGTRRPPFCPTYVHVAHPLRPIFPRRLVVEMAF